MFNLRTNRKVKTRTQYLKISDIEVGNVVTIDLCNDDDDDSDDDCDFETVLNDVYNTIMELPDPKKRIIIVPDTNIWYNSYNQLLECKLSGCTVAIANRVRRELFYRSEVNKSEKKLTETAKLILESFDEVQRKTYICKFIVIIIQIIYLTIYQ